MNVRLIAAKIINAVTDGVSLAECMDPSLAPLKDPRDRAFVQAVCYGVCRYYTTLDAVLSHLLKKPMQAKDSDVHALCLVGLYQIIYMRVPHHAAVAETVNATQKLNKAWARGFVNAILREYLRSEASIKEKIKDDTEAEYAHPQWMINAIKKAWPNDDVAILTTNNEHPPFALRVNKLQQSRTDYLAQLNEQELEASVIPYTDSGLVLKNPILAENLPGFGAGAVSVQDGASQLAAGLLDLVPGMKVLDACAAPGGKLTHLLEMEPQLETVIAVEKEAQRVSIIKENLTRLQSKNVTCIVSNALATDTWWDKEPFDRILLDAPCSASGVIRRHPDIKLLRQPHDLKNLAKTQLELLEALWPLLKPNGLLLYSTCSVFPQENVDVLTAFLAKHSDAKEKPIDAAWGRECKVGRQILPGMDGMDGFYYARLQKLP